MAEIDSNLLIAAPTGDNLYSWTLATRKCHIMQIASLQFGDISSGFDFGGIEFIKGKSCLHFPNFGNFAVIRLSKACLNSSALAYFQLAHECIHLLSSIPNQPANFLEEGTASYFAGKYMKEYISIDMQSEIPAYQKAVEWVAELLKHDANAIKNLRTIQPIMSKISKESIMDKYPEFDPLIAEMLCSEFKEDAFQN